MGAIDTLSKINEGYVGKQVQLRALTDGCRSMTDRFLTPHKRTPSCSSSSSSTTPSVTDSDWDSPQPLSSRSPTCSLQDVDIYPSPLCPPDNTPASGSGSKGCPTGADNSTVPRRAAPNRYRKCQPAQITAPEDTAMQHSDSHLNKSCLYSNNNLYILKHVTLPDPDTRGSTPVSPPPPNATHPHASPSTSDSPPLKARKGTTSANRYRTKPSPRYSHNGSPS